MPQLREIWIRNGETNHTTTVLMVLNDHVLFCINHINRVGNNVLCTSIIDFLANYHLLETEKYYPGNEYNNSSDNRGEESKSS